MDGEVRGRLKNTKIDKGEVYRSLGTGADDFRRRPTILEVGAVESGGKTSEMVGKCRKGFGRLRRGHAMFGECHGT
jgi:hypothetical protein